MKLADIKPGDVILVRGQGYLSANTRQFVVKRITRTQIIAMFHNTVNNRAADYKFNREDGIQMPRDKYINWYIDECNGERIE